MSGKTTNEAINLDQFYELYSDQSKCDKNVLKKLAKAESQKCASQCHWSTVHQSVLSLFPILTWFPKYKWREDGVSDLIAGLTVAIMHIPQGMAYAMLAGVEPVTGIYTGMWPVMVYVFLGNMAHVSMGTFAIVSILVYQIVQSHDLENSGVSVHELVTSITISVGIIQTIIGVAGLGSLTKLINDTIISSFTVGASIHVATSQVRHVLGLQSVGATGPGRLIMTYVGLAQNIQEANLITVSISCCCLSALILSDTVLQTKAKKHCKFPLPSQLVIMLIMTSVSYFLDLSKEYSVRTIRDIGAIPTGLPEPSTNHLILIPEVIFSSIPVAVVSIVISTGLGTMFGSKHGYSVPPNPECIAQGVSNIVGSFLSCLPMSASLSRSLVQENSGCKSLLTSLTSSLTLLAVILSLAPIFEPLPVCVLASIILASLTGMFRKLGEVEKYWSRSKYDGVLWIVTFLSTVLVDVDLGLIIGFIFSVIIVVIRSIIPSITILQRNAGSNNWLDTELFNVHPDSRYLVVQIRGPVNFLTVSFLRTLLSVQLQKRPIGKKDGGWKKNSVCPTNIVKVQLEECSSEIQRDDCRQNYYNDPKTLVKRLSKDDIGREHELIPDVIKDNSDWDVICDLSGVTWIDQTGCNVISWINKEQNLCGLVLPFHLQEVFEAWPGCQKLQCTIYPTLSDAVSLTVND